MEQVEGPPLVLEKLITAEETEMPRSRSTAIQSEGARRRSAHSDDASGCRMSDSGSKRTALLATFQALGTKQKAAHGQKDCETMPD